MSQRGVTAHSGDNEEMEKVMCNRVVLAVFVMFSLASNAAAQDEYSITKMKKIIDISLLRKACDGQREIDQGVCIGYLMGIADALSTPDGLFGVKACMTDGVTSTDLREAAFSELQKHPDWAKLAAAPIVARAYGIRYPCQK